MIVDSSALLAILLQEPDGARCAQAMQDAEELFISAGTYIEASIVVNRRGDAIARRRLDDLFEETNTRIEAVTEAQARIAREAYRDFGKGSGHRAGLNFGDCFAYALAKTSGQPLLCVGPEFSHTDLAIA